jgi:putative copper export protein
MQISPRLGLRARYNMRMSHHALLVLHALSAAIWVGGYLLLLLGYVPEALRTRDPRALLDCHERLQRTALPALLVLILTGLWLASDWLPETVLWFDSSLPIAAVIEAKLGLVALLLVLLIYLRMRVLTTLTPDRIRRLALVLALIALVVVTSSAIGPSFRYGGF